MGDVVDNTRKYKKAIDAFLAADGVMVEVGIPNAKEKYLPKGKQTEGTSVAKVAGIHQAAGGWHTKAIDQNMSKLDFSDRRMQAQLIAGRNPMELAAEKGEIALAAMKKEVLGQGLKESGLFLRTIKYRIKSTKQHAAERKAYRQFLKTKALAQKRIAGRFA
jgi:hypothetical protein